MKLSRPTSLCILVLAVFWPGGMLAASEYTESVVLLGDIDPMLLNRIRGQTADLDWRVRVDPSVKVENLAQARRAAEQHGVNVAMWFNRLEYGGWRIHVLETEQERLFSKVIRSPGEQEVFSASTTAEAVALVVRSSLTALAQGEQIGEVVSEEMRETDTADTPRNTDTSPVDEPKPVDGSVSASSKEVQTAHVSYWKVAAGWYSALDGESPYGQQGPSLRLAVELGSLELAMNVMVALPTLLRKPEYTLHIFRIGLLPSLGLALIHTPEIRLSSSIGAGSVLVSRKTEVRVESLEPTPTTWKTALVLHWTLGIEWFPECLGNTWGMRIAANLEVLPSPPSFRIQEQNGTLGKERTRFWTVQPGMGLALVLRID